VSRPAVSLLLAAAATLAAPAAHAVFAIPASPLDQGGWTLAAHMSNTGGMFDGQGELSFAQAYGTAVASPTASTPDFSIAISAPISRILFITGDRSVWAMADYGALITQIQARAGYFGANIDFTLGLNGMVSQVQGNVLSRGGVSEDPWITYAPEHFAGINSNAILWGEGDYFAAHSNLKNSAGGLNVYVQTVPEPSSLALLLAGVLTVGAWARKRRAV
jgi:hypothetical protein